MIHTTWATHTIWRLLGMDLLRLIKIHSVALCNFLAKMTLSSTLKMTRNSMLRGKTLQEMTSTSAKPGRASKSFEARTKSTKYWTKAAAEFTLSAKSTNSTAMGHPQCQRNPPFKTSWLPFTRSNQLTWIQHTWWEWADERTQVGPPASSLLRIQLWFTSEMSSQPQTRLSSSSTVWLASAKQTKNRRLR